jgi:hypothetical protein
MIRHILNFAGFFICMGGAAIFMTLGLMLILRQIEEKFWIKIINGHMKKDRNGYPLMVGDRVKCDGSECGRIVEFGGCGAWVKMDFGGSNIDWALDQLEWQKDDEVRG